MSEPFVSMRAWLQPRVLVPEPAPLPEEDGVPEDEAAAESQEETARAVSAARRFRAALTDAVEACMNEVLSDIVADVLGRELQLSPCDVNAIVARAIERYDTQPVAVRVHPDDAAALREAWNVIADSSLRSGDAVICVRNGTIDATLGARIAHVMAADRS